MRAHRQCLGAILVVLGSACAPSGAGGLDQLPPKVARFRTCVVSFGEHPGRIHDLLPSGVGDLQRPAELSPGDARLPAALTEWVKGFRPQDSAFLYVFAGEDGPDQAQFPLRELAALVNGLKCRFVVTVIDLPPVALDHEKVGLEDILEARRRYELFDNGMTIFTCGPFEGRLTGRKWISDFGCYLLDPANGHVDANSDGLVTVWEAYEYAFWCSFARSINQTQRPQTAYYIAPRWDAQPVLRRATPRAHGPDPQALLFAGITEPYRPPDGPAGPTGADGPVGAATCMVGLGGGPTVEPYTVDDANAWAWWQIPVLGMRLGELACQADRISALLGDARALPPGPARSDPVVRVHNPGSPGPAGPPGPDSGRVHGLPPSVLTEIEDPDARRLAEKSAARLGYLGAAQDRLRRKLASLRSFVVYQYTQACPVLAPSSCCRTPTDWPPELGAIYPHRGPRGRRGPPGPAGPASPAPGAEFDGPALWSPYATERLEHLSHVVESLEQEAHELEQRAHRMGYGR